MVHRFEPLQGQLRDGHRGACRVAVLSRRCSHEGTLDLASFYLDLWLPEICLRNAAEGIQKDRSRFLSRVSQAGPVDRAEHRLNELETDLLVIADGRFAAVEDKGDWLSRRGNAAQIERPNRSPRSNASDNMLKHPVQSVARASGTGRLLLRKEGEKPAGA
jgi:hypothetical protein